MVKGEMMLTRILIGTLVVAAVAAGALSVSACHRHRTPTERADRIAEKVVKELELTGDQTVKLQALKNEFLAAQAEMRKEHEALFDEVLLQVQGDQLDQGKLLQLMERHHALQARLAPNVLAKAAELHAALTPKQKAQAAEQLKGLRDRMHRHSGNARM
jgi:Spy/CpxP family protein refolding chaperone